MPAQPATPVRRTRRRRAAALLAPVLAIVLVTGACSSDDGGSEGADGDRETTTTEATSGEGSQDDGDGPTTSEAGGEDGGDGSQTDFGESLERLQAALQENAGDMCALLQVPTAIPTGDPQGTDEVEQAVTFTTDWLIAIAEAAPPETEAQAEVVRSTAEQLQEAARSAGFSDDFFAGGVQGLSTPDFQGAVQELIGQCAETGLLPGTGGAGGSQPAG